MKISYFLLPAVYLCFCTCASKSRLAEINVAKQYLDSARISLDSVKYDQSLVFGEKALNILKQNQKAEDTLTALAYFQLGEILTKKAKYQDAIENHRKALRIHQAAFENEHPDVAGDLHKIGLNFYYLAEYDSAMVYYQKALDMRLELFGQAHRDVATSYTDIGAIYHQQGNYDLASKYIQDGFDIRKKVLEPNHLDMAYSYYWSGQVNEKLDKLDEAIAAINMAVDIMKANVKADHPNLVSFYSYLSALYHKSGEFENALNYLQKSTRIIEEKSKADQMNYGLSYNNIGTIYLHRAEYKNALTYYERAKDFYEKTFGRENTKTAFTYYSLGNVNFYLANHEEAIDYLLRALDIYEQKLSTNRHTILAIHQSIGMVYYFKGRYDQAIPHFQSELEISLETFGEMNSNTQMAFNNIGVCHLSNREFDIALGCFQQALFISSNIFPEDHTTVARGYANIGNVYLEMNEFEKARQNTSKAEAIFLKHPDSYKNELSTLYGNLGNIFSGLNKPDSALLFLHQGLNIDTLLYGYEHPKIAFSLSSIAAFYEKEKKYDLALQYFEEALRIMVQFYGNDHVDVAILKYNIGLCHAHKSQNRLAIEYFRQALKIERDILGPGHPSLSKNYFRIGYILHKENRDSAATKYFDSTLVCLANIGKYYSTASTKGIHFSNTHFIYEKMIAAKTATANGRIAAFSISEKAKSNALLEAIHASRAKHFTGIPDSEVEKEDSLQQDIAYYDKRRQEMLDQGFGEMDTVVLQLDSKLFKLNQQLDTLFSKLENEHPAYYQAKYDFSTVDLNYVQNELLDQDQSLLEYFVGDSSIFIFLVQKDHYEVHEIKRDFPLKDWVEDMTKKGIYGHYAPQKNERITKSDANFNYTNAALQLYKKLIAPVAGRLTQNLIIIPDGILGYIPFEALLTETPEKPGAFKGYSFLIKKHQISYCYSATLLKEMRHKQHRQQPSGQLLAMAPFFRDDVEELAFHTDTTQLLASLRLRDSLKVLPASGEEVARVNNLVSGISFYGDDASIVVFQQKASDHRILHLSTHGKADDRVGDYAYLAFGKADEKGTFDKLYARDLYNYSLNADMVVLSACETGIGKLQKGEGIISLARAFAYAGAKSIFTTLWQVSDENTKDIFVDFYKYLKAGKSKDEALRLAKLDYLEKHAGRGDGTHPFFWAGLIGIGDMSPLTD